MRRILLAWSLAWVCAGTIHASDEIWTALVLATNETPPAEAPKRLENFSATVQKVFGYNSLYLLGQKKKAFGSGSNEWLVTSKDFFFRVTSLDQGPAHYRLRLELYREKELLLTTEADLPRDAPLYIRGPQWGKGQLIFLVEVR